MRYGKRLRQGDTIGFIAPSGAVRTEGAIEQAVAEAEKAGFRVKLGESCGQKYGSLSGKTEIPCSPTCAVKLRSEDPSSPFSLLLNGVSVDFDGRFLFVSGRKYETDVPPGEVTVLFDGLNFQLHACRGTLCLITAAVPGKSGLVLSLPENIRAKLTLFRF